MPPLPPWHDPSPLSLAVFLGVVFFVVVFFAIAARRAGASPLVFVGIIAWLVVTGVVGGTGMLRPGPTPPPLMAFFAACMLVAVALARSPLGGAMATSTPLWALVGVQGFRLPLELVLHRWHGEGIVPVQMTFEGLNFDIVTGVVSLAVALALRAAPAASWARPLAWFATGVGGLLLLAVMGIAVTSAPGPLYRFTDAPPIQLPLHFPTVWIVSVCVAGALFFHLVALRSLRGAGTRFETAAAPTLRGGPSIP